MTLSCLLRKRKVPATPEERVRQACLSWMVKSLNYPLTSILVEKSIRELPHLAGMDLEFPNRRLDIYVSFQAQPLLVIECKALKITEKALRQVMGYHHWLKTPFAALAGQDGVSSIFIKDGKITLQEGLPRYLDLIQMSI